MSSKTILIGLGLFGVVGKNPSMEDLPGSSLRTTVVHKTLTILLRGVKLCPRNAASMIALESAKWFDLQHHFSLWTRPKHSLLEQGVKQRDLHDNRRNTIKGGSRETKGQKRTEGGRTRYGKREIATPHFAGLRFVEVQKFCYHGNVT